MSAFRFTTLIIGLGLMIGASDCKAEQQLTHPCELLTEPLVREHFQISVDTVIEQEDRSNSRFPNCAYSWRVMSEEEEQEANARNNEKMMENIKAGKSPTEGINFNLRTHQRVNLTVAEFESPEQAQGGLESARSFMIGRDEQKGREPTPWTPVDGVGSKAYYHGGQLSFAWGRLLIHLDASPEERAVGLANAVID
jgi:hypothetical protein